MLTRSDTELPVATQNEPMTAEGTIVGTPYMTPEQLEGKGADAPSTFSHSVQLCMRWRRAARPPLRGPNAGYNRL